MLLILEIEVGKQVLFIHFLRRDRIYRQNWVLHCDGNTTWYLTPVYAQKRDLENEKEKKMGGEGMKRKASRMLSTGA